MAVTGVGLGAVHPVAQCQIAGTAAGSQFFRVELIAAGGQNDALSGQILHITVLTLDDSTHDLFALGHQLDDRGVEQHFRTGSSDFFLQLCGDLIGCHWDVEGGVPAAGQAQLIIGSVELREITGVEGQEVVFHRDLQLIQ